MLDALLECTPDILSIPVELTRDRLRGAVPSTAALYAPSAITVANLEPLSLCSSRSSPTQKSERRKSQPPFVYSPAWADRGTSPFARSRRRVACSARLLEYVAAGDNAVDFVAILEDARRRFVCAECGTELTRWQRASAAFCSAKCRYRFRDRRRYAENPERERAKARAYYWANREEVLDRSAERRGRVRVPALLSCTECGGSLELPRRVVCSSRCRDARFRRLHPEAYAAREARKVERRRKKRRAARSSEAES